MTTTTRSTALDPDVSGYRYETFTTRLLAQDLRFSKAALAPGEALSIDEIDGADGVRVWLRGTSRPLLIVTGSMSCPMTASSVPLVVELYERFGEKVDMVLLSAREAHPGEALPQPASAAEVREQGDRLRRFYGVPFAVVIDDTAGTLHRQLDTKPNAAYLFDDQGILVFRSLWASDHSGLSSALAAVARGVAPAQRERKALLRPMVRAVGYIDDVTRRAGPRARRDLWRSATPMAVTGVMARWIWFVSPARRGVALVSLIVGMFVVAGILLAY